MQGVVDVLCEACEELKWSTPTAIQKEAIPAALKGMYMLFIMSLFFIFGSVVA